MRSKTSIATLKDVTGSLQHCPSKIEPASDTVSFHDASGHSRELPWNDQTLEYLAKLSYASELSA
jgi:hypothetical protein